MNQTLDDIQSLLERLPAVRIRQATDGDDDRIERSEAAPNGRLKWIDLGDYGQSDRRPWRVVDILSLGSGFGPDDGLAVLYKEQTGYALAVRAAAQAGWQRFHFNWPKKSKIPRIYRDQGSRYITVTQGEPNLEPITIDLAVGRPVMLQQAAPPWDDKRTIWGLPDADWAVRQDIDLGLIFSQPGAPDGERITVDDFDAELIACEFDADRGEFYCLGGDGRLHRIGAGGRRVVVTKGATRVWLTSRHLCVLEPGVLRVTPLGAGGPAADRTDAMAALEIPWPSAEGEAPTARGSPIAPIGTSRLLLQYPDANLRELNLLTGQFVEYGRADGVRMAYFGPPALQLATQRRLEDGKILERLTSGDPIDEHEWTRLDLGYEWYLEQADRARRELDAPAMLDAFWRASATARLRGDRRRHGAAVLGLASILSGLGLAMPARRATEAGWHILAGGDRFSSGTLTKRGSFDEVVATSGSNEPVLLDAAGHFEFVLAAWAVFSGAEADLRWVAPVIVATIRRRCGREDVTMLRGRIVRVMAELPNLSGLIHARLLSDAVCDGPELILGPVGPLSSLPFGLAARLRFAAVAEGEWLLALELTPPPGGISIGSLESAWCRNREQLMSWQAGVANALERVIETSRSPN